MREEEIWRQVADAVLSAKSPERIERGVVRDVRTGHLRLDQEQFTGRWLLIR